MTLSPESKLQPKRLGIWWITVICCVVAMIFGIWCISQQLQYGDIVTGHRNVGYGGAPWGMYIVSYVFFVGVSFAGISVSAMTRLFGIEVLKPATRIAELVTITALIAGSLAVFADLGRPLQGMIKLPAFARPQSPFYGTFTLVVAGYLFSSCVFFFLSARRDAAYMAEKKRGPLRLLYLGWATGYRGTKAERKRHHNITFWLSVSILPLLIAAHSTLGFIFGIQPGRPGWFGALQAPSFVLLAGVSGTGMVILAMVGLRKIFDLYDEIPDATVRWLANFMATLALIYLYFMIAEELTATYAAPPAERHVAHEVVAGHFAPLFWLVVVCLLLTFLVPFVMKLRKTTTIVPIVLVCIAANVAAVCKRILIVVPSQTHGALIPIEEGTYSPTIIEYGVFAGLFGLLVLAILIFARIFPLTPLSVDVGHSQASGADSKRSQLMRYAGAGMTGFVALCMIVFGLADSFRLFSDGEIDPRVHYSPVIFAAGVMLFFCAAIVFEIFPRASIAGEDTPTKDKDTPTPTPDETD